MTTALVSHSEEQLVELLSALAACDGSTRLASRRLGEAGQDVSEGELKILRERHAGMYQALAIERASIQEEAITQEYRELARLSQRATRTFLEQLNKDLEDDTLPYELQRTMPQVVQALAKVQQVSTDKLLALTGRPTDGRSADPLEAAQQLVAMGVLKPVERPAADAEGSVVDE